MVAAYLQKRQMASTSSCQIFIILTKPGLGACCPNLSIISLYNLILLQAIKLNVSVDENNLVQVKYNTPGHIWKQETVISKDVFGGKMVITLGNLSCSQKFATIWQN